MSARSFLFVFFLHRLHNRFTQMLLANLFNVFATVRRATNNRETSQLSRRARVGVLRSTHHHCQPPAASQPPPQPFGLAAKFHFLEANANTQRQQHASVCGARPRFPGQSSANRLPCGYSLATPRRMAPARFSAGTQLDALHCAHRRV